MKRSIFIVPHIFYLKPLFFEKNENKWNQTDRHTMGSSSQLKSFPIKWNQRDRHTMGNFFLISNHYYIRNQRLKIRNYGKFDRNRKVRLFGTAPLMGFSSFFLNLIFHEK